MKGVLRDIFQRCWKSTNFNLPMLTLAAILAAPLPSLAAPVHKPTKTTSNRQVVAKVDKNQGRKDHKKEAKKAPTQAGKGKSVVVKNGKADSKNLAKHTLPHPNAVSLKKSVKTLAGGHRVKLSPRLAKLAKRPAPTPEAITRSYARENIPQEAGLFSQLREMENPLARQRLAKVSPMFRPPPTPSDNLRELIADHASTFGINPLLVQAVVAVESGFNARARSPQGAMGMMQLTPDTATRLGVSHPMDADDNIRGGTLYLKMLTEQFDGDTTLALAAYHAGPKTVEEYGGVPPNENTHLFLKRVMLYFNYYLDQE